MSASRAQQPAAQPSLQNWLPMAIDHDNSDSFSQSLIRQFDKRRTRLHAEMEQLGYRHSICFQPHTISSDSLYDSSSISNGSINSQDERRDDANNQHVEPSSTTTAPTPLARTMPTPFNYAPIHRSVTEPRRRCARNLLRRSSAYLRAKFKTAICDEDDNNHRDANNTISFSKGQQDHFYATIQPPPPPVVTQYPPKPLKYSPVEPIEDDILGNNHSTRKWFPLKMNRS
ncbi:predicted protein [Lichtheimia corymbifera JMRC:FSU:9682]|uniref:Uncharacterized protein n=1 Tax=Lichtheimia corymbifera JMRC:FSU:9682 TaxID=1263082 RepID=A0A068S6F6_9FUNG|nr:predicted protein [Lichtheimia corymbifera JMRC:FSU:9682]